MANPRIYSDRCYLVMIPQGISGFRKPAILAVVSGSLYRRDKIRFEPYTGGEGDLNARQWRIDDGHLPDCQPRVSYDAACQFVKANPYQAAFVIPEVSNG